MLDKVRYWLIKKLAGRNTIVINCIVKGSIEFPSKQGGYVADNKFICGEMKDEQYKLRAEVSRTLEKIAKERRG